MLRPITVAIAAVFVFAMFGIAGALSLPVHVGYSGMQVSNDGMPPLTIFSIVIGDAREARVDHGASVPKYELRGELPQSGGEMTLWVHDETVPSKWREALAYFQAVRVVKTGGREILPRFMARYSAAELELVDFVVVYKIDGATRITFKAGPSFEEVVNLAGKLED